MMNEPNNISEPKAWQFYILIAPVILLCLVGALITGSIGSVSDFTLSKNIIIIIGAIVLGVCCHMRPTLHLHLIKLAPWLIGLMVIPLLYLVIARFASSYNLADTSSWLLRPKEINGSVRWLSIAGFSLQVGEFAKIAICLFLAYICQKNNQYKNEFLRGFIYPLIPCGIISGLILLSNSKSMTSVCMLMCLFTLFIYGVKGKFIYPTLAILVVAFGVIVLNDANKQDRIANWENNIFANQIDFRTQAGQSIGVFSYAPKQLDFTKIELLDRVHLAEKHNDFIFALVGHQLGIFSFLVIIAYFSFFSGCLIVMRDAVTIGGKILAFSLGISIILVAFINVSVVTGLIPVTGVTAPFLSAGGSNLLVSLLSVCLLINIRAMTIQKISDDKLKGSLAVGNEEAVI